MSVWARIIDYLLTSLSIGMTYAYGSTGEILTEKSGHLNLGIPGVMCVGGAGGCIALQLLYPLASSELAVSHVLVVVLSILASFAAGGLMGLIYSFLTVTLQANQNVTGLALTTFGVGLMKFIMSKLTFSKYLYALPYFRFPFAEVSGSAKYCGVMFFLAIIIAVVASFVLLKTKVGLHLRAVGENPATADAAGINVVKYKYFATIIGSGIAGLGGLYYIMDYAGSREAYLGIEAMGWLAIALVIFALWKPHMSLVGSAVFGALYIAGSYIPGIKELHVSMSSVPLLKMLPYVFTIIVLIIISIRNKKENQPPMSLGTNYYREER